MNIPPKQSQIGKGEDIYQPLTQEPSLLESSLNPQDSK